MQALFFDIHSGISGDMILGALFNLGIDFQEWQAAIASLNLDGVKVTHTNVQKKGIECTQVTVSAPTLHHHRGLKEVTKIIEAGSMHSSVKIMALKIFNRLASAEAKVHGCNLEHIHFHEVGALDAIVDIVGACQGFYQLGIRCFYSTALTLGTGEVKCQHGVMPVPSPATLELSQGFRVIRTEIPGELCTPTGTAIVTTVTNPQGQPGFHRVLNTGYGAGTRDIDNTSNNLRLSVIELEQVGNGGMANEVVYQVECNLDDISPEVLAHVTHALMAQGCLDVWQEAINMKKGRLGVKLALLVTQGSLHKALVLLAKETTTGGIRYYPVHRFISQKSVCEVSTKFGPVETKKLTFQINGEIITRWSPEYESCKVTAAHNQVPIYKIYNEVIKRIAELENE